MYTKFRKTALVAGLVGIVLGSSAFIASANHAWSTYHWGRTANPFTLKLGDNVGTQWDAYLSLASSDWSTSNVLDTTVVPGSTTSKSCRAKSGRVEVCNNRYGSNGWLGIASIWVNGDHITQGTVKVNDTYFNTQTYNTAAWRSLVLCQEIGHTLGLNHQDEIFTNTPLGSCMDYTSDPTPNQHPNQHDYDMLEQIYSHVDTITTLSQSLPQTNGQEKLEVDHDDRASWGREIRRSSDGRGALYGRRSATGDAVFTFVIWAE